MTSKQFYKEYVKPHLKEKDKPYNRQLFHDMKDSLHREGRITEKQCQNWVHPSNKFFQ